MREQRLLLPSGYTTLCRYRVKVVRYRVEKRRIMRPVAWLIVALGVLAAQFSAAAAEAQAIAPWKDPSPHQVRFVTVDSAVRLEVLDWGGAGRPVLFVGCI